MPPIPILADFNIVAPLPLKVYRQYPKLSTETLSALPPPPLNDAPVLELPIALRKGTPSCTTKYPIAGVMSFSHLFTTFSAFDSAL